MVMPSGYWQDGVTIDQPRRIVGDGGRAPSPRRRRGAAEPRAGRDEGRLRAVIARLLHPDRVAGIEQHAGQQVEGRLRAGGDDDLLGLRSARRATP